MASQPVPPGVEAVPGFTNRWTRGRVHPKCGEDAWAWVGQKRSYFTCAVCRAAGVAPWKRQVRDQAIERYGGRCACCGETERLFLQLDHIDGGGNQHRRELGGNGAYLLATWLKRNNWPEGFQVLCANCNIGKHLNGGTCPHESLGGENV